MSLGGAQRSGAVARGRRSEEDEQQDNGDHREERTDGEPRAAWETYCPERGTSSGWLASPPTRSRRSGRAPTGRRDGTPVAGGDGTAPRKHSPMRQVDPLPGLLQQMAEVQAMRARLEQLLATGLQAAEQLKETVGHVCSRRKEAASRAARSQRTKAARGLVRPPGLAAGPVFLLHPRGRGFTAARTKLPRPGAGVKHLVRFFPPRQASRRVDSPVRPRRTRDSDDCGATPRTALGHSRRSSCRPCRRAAPGWGRLVSAVPFWHSLLQGDPRQHSLVLIGVGGSHFEGDEARGKCLTGG
jgi:hypothetical protein